MINKLLKDNTDTYTLYSEAEHWAAVVKPAGILCPLLADDIVSVRAMRLLLVSDHLHRHLLHSCTQRFRVTATHILATPDQCRLANTPKHIRQCR